MSVHHSGDSRRSPWCLGSGEGSDAFWTSVEVPAMCWALDEALGMHMGRDVCVIRRQCLAKCPGVPHAILLWPVTQEWNTDFKQRDSQ